MSMWAQGGLPDAGDSVKSQLGAGFEIGVRAFECRRDTLCHYDGLDSDLFFVREIHLK